jgi:hypothetical protein
MRTPKTLYPTKRTIYRPELPACPVCSRPLALYNYLAWDETVQTLEGVLSIASRPGHCAAPACPGHTMRLLSAVGQQIALPGSTYGYEDSFPLSQTARATVSALLIPLKDAKRYGSRPIPPQIRTKYYCPGFRYQYPFSNFCGIIYA